MSQMPKQMIPDRYLMTLICQAATYCGQYEEKCPSERLRHPDPTVTSHWQWRVFMTYGLTEGDNDGPLPEMVELRIIEFQAIYTVKLKGTITPECEISWDGINKKWCPFEEMTDDHKKTVLHLQRLLLEGQWDGKCPFEEEPEINLQQTVNNLKQHMQEATWSAEPPTGGDSSSDEIPF
jgi:hypothetical protein